MNLQNNRVFQKFQKQVKRIMTTPEVAKVHCDACKREFVPNVKDRPTLGGGKQRFFKCPGCKHTYIVANYSPLAVRILADIDKVEISLAKDPDNATLKELLISYREMLRPQVTGPTGEIKE